MARLPPEPIEWLLPQQYILLQRLDVGFNQFSGKFNELLGALSLLIGFSAEGNMLSGTLPPTMASLGLKVSQPTGRAGHSLSVYCAAKALLFGFWRTTSSTYHCTS